MSAVKKQKLADLNPTESKIFDWVDQNLQTYVEQLKEAVNIPGTQDLGDGQTCPLPPVLLVQFGDDPSKPTVCIYGHMDVQPAALEDGWDTEPFECVQKGETLFGRGTTDDKGPLVCWVAVFAAHQALGIDLPVNIKGVFEGMEEFGSIGLPDFLAEESKPGNFLANVDRTYICDNYWLGTNTPCLTYGLRGIAYYSVEVTMGTKDLHSGLHGGVVHEAMTDLMVLLSKLVDPETGNILVPGVNDQVAPLTDEERKLYDPIDFSLETYAEDVGFDHQNFLRKTKQECLMQRWRFPSLSVHGIEGAFYGTGAKTVIPRKVIGKFSIRIVPHQVKCIHGASSWLGDPTDVSFQAASAATQKVYGKVPDMTREGGSIPVTLDFVENTGKPACLLPVGASDDGAHSQNEKFDLKNMRNGIKTMSYKNFGNQFWRLEINIGLTLHEYARLKKEGA